MEYFFFMWFDKGVKCDIIQEKEISTRWTGVLIR